MDTSTHVPPGFRFHPTDEELVDYYLRRKICSRRTDLDIIKEVDLYKIEPWDIQEICKMGDDEQNEWYFFSHKDKKYPTGTRTNRATAAGFWKATGRDKAIYSKHDLIGMRKTLVFYKGRAPNGQKSDWIMHEYRLESDENGAPQEEGWAVCKVFKKKTPSMRKISEHESPYWYDHDQVSFMLDMDSPKQGCQSNNNMLNNPPYIFKNEPNHRLPYQIPQEQLIHLPLLENSKLVLASPGHGTTNYNDNNSNALVPFGLLLDVNQGNNNTTRLVNNNNNNNNNSAPTILIDSHSHIDQDTFDQVTDWRVLDKFVASQLSQEDVPKGTDNNYLSSVVPIPDQFNNKEETTPDNASTSTSSGQLDTWK